MTTTNMQRVEKSNQGWHRHQGFTMVEILVAVAISLFLLAGVVTIFVSNKHAYRVQESSNFLHENARFAMAFLGRSARMADHWGGVEYPDIDINGALALSGSGGCNQAWMLDLEYGIQGYEGASAIGGVGQFPANCILAADYSPDTDILVVRYANSEPATNGDVFLRSAVGRRAVLAQAPATGTLPTLGLNSQDGTLNNPYRVEIWFVRPCSNRAGGSNAALCDSADDDGSPIPTLTVMTLAGSTLTQRAMLEGIEQLQFEYGRDADDDGNVDRFDTASTLNALATGQRRAAWRQVVSVRVSLLARSARYDAGFTDAGTYYLAGDKGTQSSGIPVPSADQHFLRKNYQQTLHIRNRVRS